ncbi:MAG TPA: long-chain fatty acid--CoA ligase [Gemmatimonadales bacterium]|nr:long-chain fatty acid--CoA ligase [Gemmatimonadales bacterium]
MPTPRTLNELFFGAVERFADRPIAMRAKRQGAWTPLSYRDLYARVRDLSFGLGALGLRHGDRVALLSENRPEWAIADYACLALGCADVAIYPTLPAKQIEYILNDSGAAAIVVSTPAQLAKIAEIRATTPALRHVIAMDGTAGLPGVIAWDDLLARGRAAQTDEVRWRREALAAQPDDVATFIYTSGTTGDPKGVMLSHGNITSNVVAGLEVLELDDRDECLSFLPLSHIFERMAGHYVMLQAGAVINYAENFDSVPANLVEVRPTVVLSVPRLYEKIYARVLDSALKGGAIKKWIFFWAKRTGERVVDLVLAGKPVPGLLGFHQRIADRLVFRKLRARVGGRLRFFISGGAPLSADVARFFHAASLPILEGYGLTETSPVICVNRAGRARLGTVGPAIPGVEVRIAPDGEILTRGPHVMKGYYHKPDATREAIDPDGWFHTGDIGELDADGFLRITDRKKDLIVTAGGKNIAPQPIENLVKTSKFVSNAVMLGDKRKFPVMLVVPNLDNLKAWAAHKQLAWSSEKALVEMSEVRAKMEREALKTMRDLAHFEVPKKFLVLLNDFSIESGELTPTLKVKRRVVEDHYRREIDALYAEPEGGPHDLDEK